MARSKRKYYGQSFAAKCYLDAKTVNLVLSAKDASLLAEKLLRATNDQRKSVDVAVYKGGSSGDRARLTITSAE